MAAMLLLAVVGCASVERSPSSAATAPAPDPRALTRHVIVVSIDGLRPDAIQRFGARTLQRLMREGAYTLDAQTIFPSRTLPSHTSMLTGVPPSVHGVTWNDERVDVQGVVPVQTIFEVVRASGLHTAAFFSKSKFRHLLRPGSLDYGQAPRYGWASWGASRTSEDAAAYMRRSKPNLLFIHIGEPDYAGHAFGFMTRVYGENVRIADRAVELLQSAADRTYGAEGYTLLVTSDHGGHGRDHGSDDPMDMTIPWIAYGRGVAGGTRLGSVSTMDTAATVLWLLGLPVPESWVGRVVKEGFVRPAGVDQ